MDATAKTNTKNPVSASPLDERFVSRQKRRLERDRKMLVRELASVERDEREWVEESREARHDAVDLGSTLLVREVDAYLERRFEERLARVERALEKIEEGTYGLCDLTGAPIPLSQLRTIPEAIHDVGTLEGKPSGVCRGRKSHGRRKR
jgi:DnaK suppressor protein